MDKALVTLEAEVPKATRFLSERVVVGDDHAALTGGDVLVRVEADSADIAEAAAGEPTTGLPDGLRRVLDDFEAVTLRYLQYRIHVHRQAVDMDGHDRLRAGRDLRLDGPDVHVPCVGIAVHEDRDRARADYLGDAGDDRERGEDDLISFPDPERVDSRVERGGAVGHRYPVAPSHAFCEGTLELLDKGAL